MKKLNEKEMLNISGGAISASFINAIARGINTLLDLGRSLGTSIRRSISGKICSI